MIVFLILELRISTFLFLLDETLVVRFLKELHVYIHIYIYLNEYKKNNCKCLNTCMLFSSCI